LFRGAGDQLSKSARFTSELASIAAACSRRKSNTGVDLGWRFASERQVLEQLVLPLPRFLCLNSGRPF
jgi:hypothetical protein